MKRKTRPRNKPLPSKTTLALAFLLTILWIVLPSCKPKPPENEQIIHTALGANVKSLDPALTEDVYSNAVVSELYETLFRYAYLKRPVEVEPALAKAMPKVSKGGTLYEIDIKPGVFFIDDPCFKKTNGKGREIVANDFVYSLKRIADSKIQSTGWWLFNKRIKGLNGFYDKSKEATPTNYDVVVSGLRAIGNSKLRIELIEPYPQLLNALSMAYASVVPKEAVEHYGMEFRNHPVGSGPFKLRRWIRDLRLELERNPNYREDYYPSQGSAEDRERGLLVDANKRVPFSDVVYLHVFREDQPQWLNFMKGNLDASGIPKDNYDGAVDKKGNLKPEISKLGINLWKEPYPDVTYTGINMEDPLLGKNRELRLAISLGVNMQKRIDYIYNGRAIKAEGLIPPGIGGYDPKFTNPNRRYDPKAAKEALARAGYPEGKGLPTIHVESVSSTTGRQIDEIFHREMTAIGIKIRINGNTWPEFLSKINKKQASLFSMAWHGDYPDGENFLALFFSENLSPGVNSSNYKSEEFDRLYRKIRTMPDSPGRSAIYQKMVRILAEDIPWIFGVHRVNYVLQQGWFKNYKPHPFGSGFAKYYRIDLDKKRELKARF